MDKLQLRKEMELSLNYTNSVGYRMLEYGAESKHYAERILLEFVQVVSTNPLQWEFVNNHAQRLQLSLKTLAKYFANAKFASSEDGYKTVTKIEYLQQEMARIQLEMSKLQEDEPENYEAEIVEDYVPMDSQMPIPTPPEIMPGDVPLYMILKNAADAKVTNVYARRLPAKDLTSAIRMGAAIELRKVGLRSPGRTPKKKHNAQSLSNSISEALNEKFKNVKSPVSSPTDFESFDFSPVKEEENPLLMAINKVKLRKVGDMAQKPQIVDDPLAAALAKRRAYLQTLDNEHNNEEVVGKNLETEMENKDEEMNSDPLWLALRNRKIPQYKTYSTTKLSPTIGSFEASNIAPNQA